MATKNDAAARKKKEAQEQAALDKWAKEELPKIKLNVLEFPDRVRVQQMILTEDSFTVAAQAAAMGLVGKFIEHLEEEDLPIFRKYTDPQIVLIGNRVVELSGNPTTD